MFKVNTDYESSLKVNLNYVYFAIVMVGLDVIFISTSCNFSRQFLQCFLV